MRNDGGKTKGKKRKQRRGLITVLLLLLIVFLLSFLGYKTLRVAHFAVEGNEQVSDEEIIGLTKVSVGQHMLALDLGKIGQAVSVQPFLEVISVTRKFPNTLVIDVRERERDAVIQTMDQTVFIDRTGRVLEFRSGINVSGIITVKGMSITGFSLGEMLGVRDAYQLAALSKVLCALYDTDQLGWYTQIDMTNPVDIRLLSQDGFIVKLGQADNLVRQLDTAGKALTKCKEMSIASGTLDVTAADVATYSPLPAPTASGTSMQNGTSTSLGNNHSLQNEKSQSPAPST